MDLLKSLNDEKKTKRSQWYKQIGYGEYDEHKFKNKLQQKFKEYEKEKILREEKEKQEKMEK